MTRADAGACAPPAAQGGAPADAGATGAGALEAAHSDALVVVALVAEASRPACCCRPATRLPWRDLVDRGRGAAAAVLARADWALYQVKGSGRDGVTLAADEPLPMTPPL
jgi:hypothetical protein